MMKYVIYLLLLSSCYSCQKELSPLAMEICQQLEKMDSLEVGANWEQQRDSLTALSKNFPTHERLSVLCAALYKTCTSFQSPEEIKICNSSNQQLYADELFSTQAPRFLQKKIKFKLLEFYCSVDYQPSFQERISTLIFELENKYNLDAEEEWELLLDKSVIYSDCFQEYASALQFCQEAKKIAIQMKKPELIYETLRFHNRINTIMYNIDECIKTTKSLLEIAEEENVPNEPSFEKTSASSGLKVKAISNNILRIRKLAFLNFKQKNYQEAIHWYLKDTTRSSIPSELIECYMELDSLSAAFTYLEKKKKEAQYPVIFATCVYQEALIWKKSGNQTRYEECLKESVRLYDDIRKKIQNISEYNDFAPSSTYADLLWQQGKWDQAIACLEKIMPAIISRRYDVVLRPIIESQRKKMEKISQLIDYHTQAGHMKDALRLTHTYDSIRELHLASQEKWKQKNVRQQAYAKELQQSLQAKKAELNRQNLISYCTFTLLGIMTFVAIYSIRMYRRRQKQLDALYARQKEIEKAQENQTSSQEDELSPEERLFRQLERQFYEKELFRNPDFSRDDLCKLGGSNRMYVSTCINKYAGTNLNQWINKARVDYAIRLIHTGEDNLQELAKLSGFSSTTSFFRNFKQFTLLSPKQYIAREKQAGIKIENK